MPVPDYLTAAKIADLKNDPRHHTDACLNLSVVSYLDGLPHPGCTCPAPMREAREARIDALRRELSQ